MDISGQNIKVSICVLTYNQENYIEQSLESLLGQKTNFKFDVVIGEDCSTDKTATRINALAQKHNNITLLDNSKNLGVLPNFIRTLKACKGKYIAFCEGDDYWIDEHKLQKQVDFLEANPEYGGVSTNNRWFYEKENTYEDSILEAETITFESLGQSNKINSQTILFKKELISNLDWMTPLKIGDWPLNLLITSQQPYYRLSDVTTVYRVHEGGVHSLLKQEAKLRNVLDVLMTVLEHVDLSHERQGLIKESIVNTLVKLIAYRPNDIKYLRKKYFEYGGSFFNKTLVKSYIK
ncbi:glycosyltransferase [Winogradskyella eckloniae]|uniref:glycosyltransferase family 2 protein n=1 Tax=Winogradskyella eckloniae TaxID=1089306 RepID=UPI001563198B|nr:glycosyltransferase [Winogradskyella eckloniae]NRD20807.1 glycosyltransferase [Winogradskyella eckloniae]